MSIDEKALQSAWKELKKYLFIQDAEIETRPIRNTEMLKLLERAIEAYESAKVLEQPVECMQPSDYAESLRPILGFIQSISNVAPYPYVNGTQLIVDSRVMAKTLELIVGSLFHARPFKRESIYRGEPTEDAEKNLYEALCWAVTEKDRNAMILVDKEAQGDLFAVAYHKANISALNYILGFLHSHPINNKRNEIEDGSPHE